MKKNLANSYIAPGLERVISQEYAGCSLAREIFAVFLSSGAGHESLREELLAFAAREEGGKWDLRCAAVLMLERGFISVPAGSATAEEFAQRVQRYRGEPAQLISAAELRRRISRLNRVFRRLRGPRTEARFLLDFIHTSRQPCKLTFGRYLFDPEEVARRVEEMLRTSQGIAHRPRGYHEWSGAAARYRDEELPEFERRIVNALARNSRIYWAGDATPSTVNALAEYPLTTVAAVVKPPGSDIEFEIKRVGVRGIHPFGVIFARNGRPVPWSHRLYGGSAGAMLDAEAASSAKLAGIYRAVHGATPPMSMIVGMSSIRTIPAWNGEKHLLSYFTNRGDFGDGFDAMREQMAQAVGAFEAGGESTGPKGDLGLTVRFLGHVTPRQAVLAGSTSFRLKSLEQYLAPGGDAVYFTQGLGRPYTSDDARRFADSLLEEILGTFEPPVDSLQPYAEYLDAAFAHPRNRVRADRSYFAALSEIGRFWGTVLAIGGFSYGESFVDRNVGLRSKWTTAGWAPRICFMDHDSLVVPGFHQIEPARMIDGMRSDEWYILGNDPTMTNPLGVALSLNRIYRTGSWVRAEGASRFRRSLAVAYRKTRRATSETLAKQFSAEYLRAFADWEETVRRYLGALHRGVTFDEWRRPEEERLTARGHPERFARELADSAKYGEDFFRRYDFLYGAMFFTQPQARRKNAV
jgi:hypothetical protein